MTFFFNLCFTPRKSVDSSAKSLLLTGDGNLVSSVCCGSWTVLGTSPFPNEQSIQMRLSCVDFTFFTYAALTWTAEFLQMAKWHIPDILMRLPLYLLTSYSVGSQEAEVSL